MAAPFPNATASQLRSLARTAYKQCEELEPFTAESMAAGAAILNHQFRDQLVYFGILEALTLDLASHPIPSTAEKAVIFHRGTGDIWIAVYAQKGERLVLVYDGIGGGSEWRL
ncbi:hypothetical protein B0T26DRAFT_676813 [Lasiosphaeria miniovina]|uniref:Uncharacterized protein n=1 Tax=Lasiosphaeria miniovina TaxID=1954250 RepID=A0AA40DWZ2_9PEZI|nr:uncharacterized protein B0T26DRAFT_676813 [Lasiosphaeria miniovina]KAK0718685.1 hypothetical protein B0T26DRAFT_676813 [Lasiosphaeria miniovina]